MAIGTTAAILIGAGIAAAGAVGGATISAKAQKEAAETQVEAAEEATEAEVSQFEQALDFQREQFEVGREERAPFLAAGQQAVGQLGGLLAPGSEFLADVQQPFEFGREPFEFGQDELQQDPGFKFRLQEGTRALERAASARGSLVSGGQLRDLTQFGQELASQEFGVARGRALEERGLAFQEELAEFESGRAGRLDRANLLSTVAGLGQTTAQAGAQAASAFGQAGAQTLGTIGRTQATGIQGQAQIQAADDIARAQTFSDTLGSVGQTAADALLRLSLSQPTSTQQPILLN